jgi:FixJ family two-component response regulator
MNQTEGTVYFIDDDAGMRKALTRLFKTEQLQACAFSSAEEFLKHKPLLSPACLVADVCMPGLSGMELQGELTRRKVNIPIVFITGHGNVPMSVKAMKAGAVDFLQKPFNHQDLLKVIRQALAKDKHLSASKAECLEIQRRLDSLTPREREVFQLVIRGLLNKQIAAELGATEQTIKVHRHRVMMKMQVNSVAEMVQAAVKIGVLNL